MYLSRALFSGNTETAVIRISDEILENLPPKARENVFQTKSGDAKILPLFEWAMTELNAPVYPELCFYLELLSISVKRTTLELKVLKQSFPVLAGFSRFNGRDAQSATL